MKLKNKINQEKKTIKNKDKIRYKNKLLENEIKKKTLKNIKNINNNQNNYKKKLKQIQSQRTHLLFTRVMMKFNVRREKKKRKRKQIYWSPISSHTH